MNKLLSTIVSACAALTLQAQVNPGTPTVCNPCNLPYRYNIDDEGSNGFREAADPSLVKFNGEYYLFASKCGTYFHSTDLMHWTPVKSNLEELKIGGEPVIEKYAPTVEEMNDRLYFTPSTATTNVYVTADPKGGKWEKLTGAGTKDNQNDPMMLYTQERMYMYWGSSGSEADWLCGQEFDTETMKPKGGIVNLTQCNKAQLGWEVPGDNNENPAASPWLEGVWVTEHDGKYYFQYSAPGTEMKSYCDAVYVSDSPLGPYTVQRTNPMCYRPEGFIASAGHGSTFQDVYGNWWHISTGTISVRHMFERRLVLYPVFFDADGEMYAYTGFGDYPMIMPDKKISRPDELKTGWMLLSYGKTAKGSSTGVGRGARYGVNEDIRTWWSAKTGNEGEWYQVDLGNRCDIYAVQVNFADDNSKLHDRQTDVYKYKVEVSDDGETWTTVADKSDNTADTPHDYITFAEVVKSRYVRIYNVHTPDGRFSISGLRVFGINPDVAKPAQASMAKVERNAADRRSVTLSWNAVEGATGYNIRYGISPDKLYLNHTIHGDKTSLTINSLNTEEEYFFTVDAFNEAGVTEGGAAVGTATDPSGITAAVSQTGMGNGVYYSLNGMPVSDPSDGIFIHNSKKVAIR